MKLRPLLLSLLAACCLPASGWGLPFGFVDEPVIGGWDTPTVIEFDPAGRLWVGEKDGRLWVVNNGQKHLFIDLVDEVHSGGDKGFLGLTFDPGFANNGYVYLLYMVDPIYGEPDEDAAEPTFGRLTRYTSVNDTADPASRLVLLGNSSADGTPACHTSHTIGTVRFAADGTLLLGSGEGSHFDFIDAGQDSTALDAECEVLFGAEQDIGSFRAQSLASYGGKILRIDPATGLGFSTNPFYDGNLDSHASRIWVRGLRNPFRFTVRPGTPGVGTLFIGDVGQAQWEEVNIAHGGENFGWPCYEGNGPQPGFSSRPYTKPICDAIPPGSVRFPAVTYNHTNPGTLGFTGFSVTGGVFYTGTSFPAEYQGKYFFADFVLGWIRYLDVNNWDFITGIHDFSGTSHWVVDLDVDPLTGDLCYINIYAGEVRRIRYAIEEVAPNPVATAQPAHGAPPLTVHFSSDGTSDPLGAPLSAVSWTFGDGSPPTGDANPVHTYSAAGTFTATLTVTNQTGITDSASVQVSTLNAPPVVVITAPKDGYLFSGPESLAFHAIAVDPEGGPLDYHWEVGLVHNSHVHPAWYQSDQPSTGFTVTPHGSDGDRYHYRITATVTDTAGLSASDTVRVLPADGTVNHAPVAAFLAAPYQGSAPLLVTLDAGSTVDPDIDLLDFLWDYGDGTSGTGQTDTHIFGAPGLYTITLNVVDPAREAGQATATVLVDLPTPLVWWKLNEAAGDLATDDGSLRLDGEVTGGTWGAGMVDGALDFADSSGGVTSWTPVLSNRASFTLAAWVRPAAVDSAAGIAGQHQVVELGFPGGGDIRVWTAQGGSIQIPYPFSPGEWHHVAVVGTGTQLTLYLDGAAAASTDAVAATYGSSPDAFGLGGGILDAPGPSLQGWIDDLRLYGDALGPAAVVYVATAPGSNAPPTVDAGADFDAFIGELAVLYGTVGDDGLPSPPASLSYTWEQISGPDTAEVADPTALYTTLAFEIPGTYVFRLTADDSDLPGSDDVTVTAAGQSVDVPGNRPELKPGLREAVPNPARSHAMIAFRLVAPDPQVRLTVHDVTGRRVAVLQDGPLGGGDHTVFWDRRDERGVPVAAGNYFLLLQTSNERYTSRLTVLR